MAEKQEFFHLVEELKEEYNLPVYGLYSDNIQIAQVRCGSKILNLYSKLPVEDIEPRIRDFLTDITLKKF